MGGCRWSPMSRVALVDLLLSLLISRHVNAVHLSNRRLGLES